MQQQRVKNQWHYALHKLFDHPSVVLIGGKWKTGKTDFGLKISEDLKKLPSKHKQTNPKYNSTVITEVASNIDTDGHYPQIYDLVTLRQWLYSNSHRKLYIFDEASEHLPSRRSMSSKNVGFIQLIPEISKAHARMLVIGHQLLKIDKTFLDEVWCRGVFIKKNLKNAQLFSGLIVKPMIFKNIPPTSISFDPYAIAPFQELPSNKVLFKEEDLQLLWEWSNGKTYKELGVYPMQLHRKLKKYVHKTLENQLNA